MKTAPVKSRVRRISRKAPGDEFNSPLVAKSPEDVINFTGLRKREEDMITRLIWVGLVRSLINGERKGVVRCTAQKICEIVDGV